MMLMRVGAFAQTQAVLPLAVFNADNITHARAGGDVNGANATYAAYLRRLLRQLRPASWPNGTDAAAGVAAEEAPLAVRRYAAWLNMTAPLIARDLAWQYAFGKPAR